MPAAGSAKVAELVRLAILEAVSLWTTGVNVYDE